MLVTKEKYGSNNRYTTNLVRYNDMADLIDNIKRSPYSPYYQREAPNHWAGGAVHDLYEQSLGGRNSYTDRADKLMDKLGKVAMETVGIDMDYNTEFGMLDIDAYEAGVIECIYGNTHTETERAPIKIYMDQWISSTVSAAAIEMRGVACLALLQALMAVRPVMLDVVCANHYSPTYTNTIQTMQVPPGNLSLGAWMVASPLFVRRGLMGMVYHHGGSHRSCGIPMLQGGRNWQATQLGKWLAEKDGVDPDNVVFLPMMYDNGQWNSLDNTIRWIKKEMKRLLGDQYMEQV